MKKLFLTLVFALSMICLSSCGGSSSQATDTSAVEDSTSIELEEEYDDDACGITEEDAEAISFTEQRQYDDIKQKTDTVK